MRRGCFACPRDLGRPRPVQRGVTRGYAIHLWSPFRLRKASPGRTFHNLYTIFRNIRHNVPEKEFSGRDGDCPRTGKCGGEGGSYGSWGLRTARACCRFDGPQAGFGPPGLSNGLRNVERIPDFLFKKLRFSRRAFPIMAPGGDEIGHRSRALCTRQFHHECDCDWRHRAI